MDTKGGECSRSDADPIGKKGIKESLVIPRPRENGEARSLEVPNREFPPVRGCMDEPERPGDLIGFPTRSN